MSDFEMPYFVDGGGNKGYFVDSTAREQIKTANDKIATKVEGLVFARSDNTSLTAKMDGIKAQNKNGAYVMYCSSANPDFATIGYCTAIGLTVFGAVSVIVAVNSQTGDVWTNGNTSQDAGAWRGWKKVSSDKRSISVSSSVIGSRVDIASYTDINNPYTTPHEGFVRFAGTIIDMRLYGVDAMRSSSATDVRAMWLPKGVKISFSNTPSYAHWYNCSDE